MRVVNGVVDEIDLRVLVTQYKGGGTSAYHPRMMLIVLVYAYVERIYSSRQIEKALRENLNFMWLSGMNRPIIIFLSRGQVNGTTLGINILFLFFNKVP